MQYVIKSLQRDIIHKDGKIIVVIFVNNLPQEGALKYLQDKGMLKNGAQPIAIYLKLSHC